VGQGLFITFEGIDGSGKSTYLLRLQQYLSSRGLPVEVTREPGGTELAEILRELLLHSSFQLDARTEVLLYLAARAHHTQYWIKPALDLGKIVLCDRFDLSTLAYQGYGRGLDVFLLEQMNRFATGGLTPHLTLLFDLPVEVAKQRNGGKGGDRMESEGEDFYQKVRQGYLKLRQAHPQRIKLIDADREEGAVWEEVKREVEEFLAVRGLMG